MPAIDPIVSEEQRLFLSSLSPGPAQKRLALAVVLGILAAFVFITVGLLSGAQATRIDAFLPAYLSAMFVCDSITAILLFAQFSIVRSRAILVIASGYLFTALRRQGLVTDELVLQLTTFLRSLDLFLELIVLTAGALTASQVRRDGKQGTDNPELSRIHSGACLP